MSPTVKFSGIPEEDVTIIGPRPREERGTKKDHEKENKVKVRQLYTSLYTEKEAYP